MLAQLIAGSLLLGTSTANTNLDIPATAPVWAQPLPKDFVGLAVEFTSLAGWAGRVVGQPNTFVNAALNNLKALTGSATSIRVGGSSQDFAVLNSSLTNGSLIQATFPAATSANPFPAATAAQISPKYYLLSGNFPAGTAFTWGINLLSLNVNQSVAQASAIADAFQGSGRAYTSNVTLEHLELGNEPDFYGVPRYGGVLGSSYNIFNFSAIWQSAASAVVQANSQANFSFIGPSFANNDQLGGFGIPQTLQAVYNTNTSKYWTTYNTHLYSGVNTGNASTNVAPGTFFSKNAVRSSVTARAPYFNLIKAAGLKNWIGETNTAANHGIDGVSNSAEATLFLSDMLLQCALNGVDRVDIQNGEGYYYSVLQAVPIASGAQNSTTPKIYAPYYAMYIVNDFIGSKSNTTVIEMATSNANTSAYAAFDDGRLGRALIFNNVPYLPNATSRPSETVSLRGLTQGRSISAKRFVTPYTTSVSNLTWGGVSLDNPTSLSNGTTETITNTTITINAAEIVMLTFS